jgi:phosphopantetheinyl transferase
MLLNFAATRSLRMVPVGDYLRREMAWNSLGKCYLLRADSIGLVGKMSSGPSIVWTTARVDASNPTLSDRRTAGRALALQLLVALGGEGWTIEIDARGKPVACGAPVRHISIAHTGNIVAAAASAVGPIGIDVEYRDPDRDLNRLARAAYGPSECQAVTRYGVSAFYRIWTLREAIGKATGDGMALVTDRIDRVPICMMDGSLVAAGDEWLFAHEVIAQDFSLALAVRVASAEARSAAQGCSLDRLRLRA